MFDLDSCVSFLTNKASKILSESLNDELLKYGITKSQWIVMYYLGKEGEMSQKSLSQLIDAKEPTTTGLLERIENQGYIKRKPDKKDKRKKLISLTKNGKMLNNNLVKVAQEFRDECLKDVDKEEQKIFLEVLDKMVISAQNWRK